MGEVDDGAGDCAEEGDEVDQAVAGAMVAVVHGYRDCRRSRDEAHPVVEALGDGVHG